MKDNSNKEYFEIVGAPKPADIPFEELIKTKIIKDENIQKTAGIRQKIDKKIVKSLGKLPNKDEFWANIYNDFFNGLQKIYWLGSSKIMSWESFVNHQMNGLKINVADWEKSELAESWRNIVKSNIFYLKILAGISYANPDFYDEIIEKLKNK